MSSAVTIVQAHDRVKNQTMRQNFCPLMLASANGALWCVRAAHEIRAATQIMCGESHAGKALFPSNGIGRNPRA